MLKLYPSTAVWDSIERLDLMEMRLRLPARRSQGNQYLTRKRFWSASQMIASEQDCGPITVSFVSFSFPHSLHERSYWMLEHPIAREHKTDLNIITLIRKMVQKVRRETYK